MIICIVGSVDIDEKEAKHKIFGILGNHDWTSDVVISGGAKGVDSLAEEVAKFLGFRFVVFKPMQESWSYYKQRNWSMAYACDTLYRIKSKTSKTYGSGWTRDRAKEMGKPTEEIVI